MSKSLNVVSFETPKADAEVVEVLERLLASAKSGELRAICFCATKLGPNGADICWGNNVGFADMVTQIGYINLMARKAELDFLGDDE